ncbi:MAG: hypothetical protein N2512_05580 [Armatimonadetes bacterium]|nr:hypothetical protein [Armatimonadota bacterium]
MQHVRMLRQVIVVFLVVAPSLAVRGEGIDWHPTYEAALQAGKRNGRIVYVFVYLPRRAACAQMDQRTFKDPKVRSLLSGFECGAVDASTPAGGMFVERYKMQYIRDPQTGLKLATVPGHVFFRPDGTILHRQYGFIPPPGFVALLQRIRRLHELQVALQRNPKDAGTVSELSHLLLVLGHDEEGRRYAEMAIALDPDNAAGARERAHLDLAILTIKSNPELAVERLLRWLDEYRGSRNRVEAQFYLATAYVAADRTDEALAVLAPFERAKKGTPEAESDWGARARALLKALKAQ